MSLIGQRAPFIVMWQRLKPQQNGVWLTKQGGDTDRNFAVPKRIAMGDYQCRV
ncbi:MULTISPECIES: hypothetical protein [unclassified Mesorhizobium]|uniref:hypothetical protein n=1 Tax=unclassified Mesorhizobium TaxID=325217 RepID=UPI0016747CB4|nr:MULTISPECIES: hypothetical protein [unclassified Mesorhizobium]